jgi:large subunit ribosomal protein L7/L12
MSEEQISNEISKIIKEIDGLNLGQISKLIEEIKGKYNIQETAVIQSTSTQESEKVEEKTSNVSVKLVEVGNQKILVYKVIMDFVEGLNIVKAKELAEKEGGVILENVPREKAEEAKKKLEEKGAKVEIK